MKKKKYIIIVLIILIVLSGLIVIITINNKMNKKESNKVETKQEVDDYYKNMHKRMFDYYKIMYKIIDVPEDKKNRNIIISLGDLKREGFPMEDFVNKDTNEDCDLTLSYARRIVKNNQYEINVYYKCGTVANYDYTKEKQESNKSINNTTTKAIDTTTKINDNQTITKSINE